MSATPGQMFSRPLKNWVRHAAMPKKHKPVVEAFKWKIFRGDTVFVRSGRDAGKSGKVKRVMHKQHRLVVTGLNSIKRAVKPTEATVGGIIAVESPIHYSRVSLVDPSDGKPCKVAFRWTEKGSKVRVSKRSGNVIPYPKLEERYTPPVRPTEPGLRDTAAKLVAQQTYVPPAHLRAYLSPARSTAAAAPEALAAAGRPAGSAASVSIFTPRTRGHLDRVPAVLKLSLKRKDRLKLERRHAREVEGLMLERLRAAQQPQGVSAAAASAGAAALGQQQSSGAELR